MRYNQGQGVILHCLGKRPRLFLREWHGAVPKIQQEIETLKNTLKGEAAISFTFASRFAR